MANLGQDIRYALRLLVTNPAFTAVAVLTLALGIGANTAIFSVVRAALLTPIAIPAPDRVMLVWTENAARGWHHVGASVPDYQDWKQSGVFEELAAFNDGGFNLRMGERTQRIAGLFVTKEMLEAVRAKPLLGRIFQAGDFDPGHSDVVILSYAFWQSNFAADPSIIGKSVVLDGSPQTIVGVLPSDYPKMSEEQICAPLVFRPPSATDRGSRSLGVMGRLRNGVSPGAAQSRLTDLEMRLGRQFPGKDADNTVALQPLQQAYVENVEPMVLVLFYAVGFVLLIACANIANLLLARGPARERELAIRAALGANRGTLVRQLLTESVLLALIGGAVGILPAVWGIDFISSFKLMDLPHPEMVSLNGGVLAFTVILALATGILFGLAPALQVWSTDVNENLKAAGRSYSSGVHQRLRSSFVVSEIALTLILLVGAGLMVQSFVRLRSANPGFNPHGALTLSVALSDRQYATPEARTAFYDKALRQVSALPGVETAGASDTLPSTDRIRGSGVHFADRPEPATKDVPIALVASVTPDYFRAMQIPFLGGRYFTPSDQNDAPLVAAVDEWMAKHYWPNADPLGKRIRLGNDGPWRTVVGLVGSVEQPVVVRLVKGQVGQVYVPFSQDPKGEMSLVIRAAGDPAALIPEVRKKIGDIDTDQPIFEVQTLEDARASGRTPQQLTTLLLGGFAGMALLLAAIGIYGVVSYSVGQRTREIGIRVAMGASRKDVLSLVLKQGVLLAFIGVGAGLAGALVLTRLMSSLLYGVRPTDPLTFAAVSLLLTSVALVATYIPALRATRVDPVVALRYE